MKMRMIKLEISMPEVVRSLELFIENRFKALEEMAHEIRTTVSSAFNHLLSTEMSIFLGKADQAHNKQNGYETRDYTIKGIGTIRVKVPADRKRRFESSVVPKSERLNPRLKQDMAALHLADDIRRRWDPDDSKLSYVLSSSSLQNLTTMNLAIDQGALLLAKENGSRVRAVITFKGEAAEASTIV
jgi:hypothetical protein